MNISIRTTSNREPLVTRVRKLAVDLDRTTTAAIRPAALPALRILLGGLFIWFGALKITGESPVANVVSGTLPWADPQLTVVALGGAEVALGAALVSGVLLRVVLPMLAAHLTGTFLTFVMLPELMFRSDNPLLLTQSGEFVIKNLVLLAATLVLMSHTGTATAAAAQVPEHQVRRLSDAPQPALQASHEASRRTA